VKHFSETQLADLVRNLVSPGTKMTMQKHIDGGCKKCSATLQIWQGVLAIASAEAAFTPPDGVVRIVKSQFAQAAPEANQGFRLLFDSRLQPVTAGIRGSVTAGQFLYETDEYYIDLRLEPRREADRACLIGQVLNRAGSSKVAAGIEVCLRIGKVELANTATNQFGEFQLEFDASQDLFVSIGRSPHKEIVLPIYGLNVKPAKREDFN
jgi:hypothetical protein